MRWFKHKVTAADDPFIRELIHKFKGNGYMIYFVILEMMGDNFNPQSPGKIKVRWQHLREKCNLYRRSILPILDFINKKFKFEISYNDEEVCIYCPKFQEVMDDYAKRQMKQGVRTIWSGSTNTKNQNFRQIREDKNNIKREKKTKRWGIFHIKDVLKKLKLGKGE